MAPTSESNDREGKRSEALAARGRQWESEEPWDRRRIEGFRVVSPNTEEVNWPRDVIRAHMAAREDEDTPELPPNVRRGAVLLKNAPPTARMRHEARGLLDTPPLAELPDGLHASGAAHEAPAAAQFEPDGGPRPSPSEILHPDRLPVFTQIDSAPMPDHEPATVEEQRAYWEANPSPLLHPNHPKFEGLDLLVTPTGPPMADRLTRKQRQEGALEMIGEMSDAALERLRRKEYRKPLHAVVEDIAEFAEMAEEAARTTAERLGNTGVHEGRSPAITGPYRGGKPSRFRVNGVYVLVATVILVGLALIWAFVWLATNWTY